MTNPLELIGYTVAILVMVAFSLWIGSLWLDRSDDAAAGIKLGPDSQLSTPPLSTSPWPAKHFISSCMYCHHVTRSDSRPVRVGDELRVSHGICPRCMADKHPEVANVAELAHA